MDFTSAAGFAIDAQGRRQFQDRDIQNGIGGTSILAEDLNGIANTIMFCILAAKLKPDAKDDTLLHKAIVSMISDAASSAIGAEVKRALAAEAELGTLISNTGAGWTAAVDGQSLTKPSWATRLDVILTGGGGGGAGCQANAITGAVSGSGGGAGATTFVQLAVQSNAQISVSVGSGGGGGSGVTAAGGGGNSTLSVGKTLVAASAGGAGGSWYSANGSAGAVGGYGSQHEPPDGVQILSIFTVPGGSGSDGQARNFIFQGSGGASYWGGSGRAGSGGGISGGAPGTGGGGAYDIGLTGSQYGGAAGMPGMVQYRWLP